MGWLGEMNWLPLLAVPAEYYNALADLWNSIVCRIHQPGFGFEPGRVNGIHEGLEQGATTLACQSGNILHNEVARGEFRHKPGELEDQTVTVVQIRTDPLDGEALARRTTNHQVYRTGSNPCLPHDLQCGAFCEVSADDWVAEIAAVGFNRNRPKVGCKEYIEPCGLEAERESACSAKEIDCSRPDLRGGMHLLGRFTHCYRRSPSCDQPSGPGSSARRKDQLEM